MISRHGDLMMRTMLVALLTLAAFAAIHIAAPTSAGAEEKSPTTAPDQGPAKFYGAISAVDAKAMTFTVDNKVYHVVSETQMTKAVDGSKATIDDATVGETARGTYTQASDGTM